MRAESPGSLHQRPLIFLHIPRTGGTTLTRIARRQYPAAQIYMIDSRDPVGSTVALESLPWFARGRLSLIAGHASFGVHRYTGGGTYFTLVRDPVARVLSHYRYAQQRSEHPMHALARSMTLSEMLRAGVWSDLSNGQCQALAGVMALPDERLPQVLLDRAMANLEEHFALWGLMERYPETLLMARATLGWEHLYHSPENASRPAPPAADASAEIELVRRHNALDLALYGQLETRFQEALGRLVPDPPRELARLRLESLLDEPRRRLRRSYEKARLRADRKGRSGHHGQSDDSSSPVSGPKAPPQPDKSPSAAVWLRRWVVGGYDWQVGQKEWLRRRMVGEYGWGRIAESFEFMEELLKPCGGGRRRQAYDVGCGAGYLSFALASQFENVLAVDRVMRPILRGGLLTLGTRPRRLRFVRADAERFGPPERFDLILCNLMSHTVGSRLRLLHRLATLTDVEGWVIYSEEVQGYAPMEIEAAIAGRNLLALRTRLRQVVAGMRGDPVLRFFVAPTARGVVEALGFEVVKEETTWWRSLPATHRIWCRRREAPPPALPGADADYLELASDLLGLRSFSPSADSDLAPLLILAELARSVLPHAHQELGARLPPAALHAVDSLAGRDLDWRRIEDGFARFVDALDGFSPAAPIVRPEELTHSAGVR
jgi:2-polyprenyl-3-methyl-5-hydroxy-6-metoxy-1,4-benzoquinol methylase